MRMKSVFVKNVSIFGALVGFLSFPVFCAEDIHVLAYTDDIPTDYVTTNSFITATNQTEYFKRDKADLNVYGTFNSPEIIITNRTYTPNDRSKNYTTVDVEIAPIRLTPKFLGVYKFDDESVDGYTVYRFGDCEAELPLLDGQTKPDKVRIDEIRVASPSDPGKIFFIHSDYLTYDMDSNEYLRHRHGGGLNYVVGHVSTNSYFYEGKTYGWIDVRGASWNFSLTGPLYTDCDVITNKIATKNDILTAADAGTNYVDAATNAVMTSVDGKGYLTSESDPTTGMTNDVPYVRGKKVLTSESDPAWRAWTNGTSVALGLYSTASGDYSMALGQNATAVGHSSTAVGRNSSASGVSATALGYSSTASKVYSMALGLYSTASGEYSMALGYLSKTSGASATAVGRSSTARGGYSTAVGRNSSASGEYSTALGYMAYAPANSLGLAYTPDTILLCSSNTTTARSLRSYLRYTRKTLDTASFTAEDGVIYSLTLDDTMAASGIDITLPESKDWVQDFILRLENPTTSATQFGDLGAAAIDYPNGKLTETGAIEAGTTNYFTFTETGAGRWLITSLPVNK